MSCEIIKERERKIHTEYKLNFDNGDGGGFAFPCDENGNVFEDMHDCAKENYKWCLEHPKEFIRQAYVEKYSWSYTEPAIARCSCGQKFELIDEYMGATECPKCHQWYNLFGQELINPEYWEEEDY